MRAPDGFRDDRWRRAGATTQEIAKLRRRHRKLPYDEQVAETARVDSVSDLDLADDLTAARPPQPPSDGDTPPAAPQPPVDGDPPPPPAT